MLLAGDTFGGRLRSSGLGVVNRLCLSVGVVDCLGLGLNVSLADDRLLRSRVGSGVRGSLLRSVELRQPLGTAA